MPTVKFVNEKKTVECEENANLRAVAMKSGVEVYSGIHKVAHCPGLGLCTTCKMKITKGTDNVSRQGFWEWLNMANLLLHPVTFLARLGQEKELRLSCQTRVQGDVEVETRPPFNWHGERFWG